MWRCIQVAIFNLKFQKCVQVLKLATDNEYYLISTTTSTGVLVLTSIKRYQIGVVLLSILYEGIVAINFFGKLQALVTHTHTRPIFCSILSITCYYL